MKKKRKKTKKRTPSDFSCRVPGCDRRAGMGWEVYGKNRRICKYHFARHCNENDSFDLFSIFKINKLSLDRFGFVKAKDHDEMAGRTKRQQQEERKRKKEEGLARLKEWKESNGNQPRRKKPKPRPEKAVAAQEEMDDIVGNILNGD